MRQVLLKNSLLSLVFQVFPSLVGLVSIPLLIRLLGIERFGLLTLIWVVVGYFSIFDLGISRVLTKLVADEEGKSSRNSVLPYIIGNGLSWLCVLSFTGTLIFLFGSKILAEHFLKTSDELFIESVKASIILGLSLPFVSLNSAVKGILEGKNQMTKSGFLQTLIGLNSFLSPIIGCSILGGNLPVAVGSITFGRLVLFMVYFKSLIKHQNIRWNVNNSYTRMIFSQSQWIALGNIVSPLMAYMDRLLLVRFTGAIAIAYYTTPFEVVSKLWLIPSALTRVAFPNFAKFIHDEKLLLENYKMCQILIHLLLIPISVGLITFKKEILSIWLGPEFAVNSNEILAILSVGIFINCLNWAGWALLQAGKDISLTGKFLMIEVVFYGMGFYYFVTHWGATGAAVLWSLRMLLDFLLIQFWLKKAFHSFIYQIRQDIIKIILIIFYYFLIKEIPSLQFRIAIVGSFFLFNLLFFLKKKKEIKAWFFQGPRPS